MSQVKSVFANFAESLEARFSLIDHRFSQVISRSASSDSHSRVDVSCQDAITNHSRAAPTPVAVRFEHPSDRAPSTSYSDDLGTILGGLTAVSMSLDTTSLSCMLFADLMTTVQFFESSSGRVPDNFLDTPFPSSLPSMSAPPDFSSSSFASVFLTSILWLLHFPFLHPLSPQSLLHFLWLLLLVFLWLLLLVCIPLSTPWLLWLLPPRSLYLLFCSWPYCLVSFSSFICACPCCIFPSAPVTSSSFPFGSASSADTVVPRSLLTIVFRLAPSLSSLAAPTPLVLPVVSLSPASLLATAPGYPSAPPAPLSFFVSSGAPGIPPSASGVLGGLKHFRFRGYPSASRGSALNFAGTSGASDSSDDTFLYHGFDDSSVKGGGDVCFG